jgi:hypothetical protein
MSEYELEIVLDALDSLHEDMRWKNKEGKNVSPYSYNLREVEKLYYKFAQENEDA